MVSAVLVRFPFWFESVIDWDESTLILMGQELVDRRLAYVELWDNKPPLAFVPYAVAISLFGQSIVAVRAMGALFVAVGAFLVYRLGRDVHSPGLGVGAALLTVVFVGATDGGQATLAETLALVPLLAAAHTVLGRRLTTANAFWAGFFFAVAALVRSNLALVSAVAWSIPLRQALKERDARPVVAYALGTAVPLLTVATKYLAAGHMDTLIASAMSAPLRFSTNQLTMADALTSQARQAIDAAASPLWVGTCVGLAVVWLSWTDLHSETRDGASRMALLLAAVLLSVGASGADHAHYLIQAVPLAALFAAVGIGAGLKGRYRHAVLALTGLGLAIALVPVGRQTWRVTGDLVREGSVFTDPGYRISEHLAAGNPEGEPILLLTDHIAYWLNDTRPPGTRIAHPSNLGRTYFLDLIVGPGTSPEGHLRQILAHSPRYVVTEPDPWFFDTEPEAESLLEQTLESRYRLDEVIGGREIHVRR